LKELGLIVESKDSSFPYGKRFSLTETGKIKPRKRGILRGDYEYGHIAFLWKLLKRVDYYLFSRNYILLDGRRYFRFHF